MGATPPQAPAFEDEISLLEILNVLLKRWRTVIGLPVTTSLAVVGISFLVPPTYTAGDQTGNVGGTACSP